MKQQDRALAIQAGKAATIIELLINNVKKEMEQQGLMFLDPNSGGKTVVLRAETLNGPLSHVVSIAKDIRRLEGNKIRSRVKTLRRQI